MPLQQPNAAVVDLTDILKVKGQHYITAYAGDSSTAALYNFRSGS